MPQKKEGAHCEGTSPKHEPPSMRWPSLKPKVGEFGKLGKWLGKELPPPKPSSCAGLKGSPHLRGLSWGCC